MKVKCFILLILFAGVFIKSKAQISGGEMFYTQDSVNPMKFELTINFYWGGGPFYQDSAEVDWGDGLGWVYFQSWSSIGFDHYKCTFKGSHTYSAIPINGIYLISISYSRRFSGMANIWGGGGFGEGFCLLAVINLENQSSLIGNHSPVINNDPFFNFFLRNQPIYSAPLVTDADGDSLVITRMVPFAGRYSQVGAYQYPEQVMPGASNKFAIDSITGEIVWDSPQTSEIYSFAYRILEYRNGNLLGWVMRDQNIYVLANPNSVSGLLADDLTVSPNPATTKLFCNLAHTIPKITLQILSIDGRALTQPMPAQQSKTEVDISHLPAGLYFLVVQDEKQRAVRKFVKE
ncbi:MAG: T9SS type A sorting domain-containing protein [Bacteroidota bacterium]